MRRAFEGAAREKPTPGGGQPEASRELRETVVPRYGMGRWKLFTRSLQDNSDSAQGPCRSSAADWRQCTGAGRLPHGGEHG